MPGSKGNFKIEIDATGSESEINYQIIVLEEKNIPKNFEFYAEIYNEKNEMIEKTDKYENLSNLAKEKLFGNISLEKNNQKRNIIIYWNWKDEQNDIFLEMKDGTISLNENSSLESVFCIEIIGKQI